MNQWLNLDTTKTFDRVNEFEQAVSDLLTYYDGYYDQLNNFKYKTITYPSITNLDLSVKAAPWFLTVTFIYYFRCLEIKLLLMIIVREMIFFIIMFMLYQ